jgi:DNA-binding MarR family transcriptional regulator
LISENSRSTYDAIIESLAPRQTIIFEALRNNPATNKTLAKRMGLAINQVTPRTLELRKKGLVKKMYSEEQDGHTATVWGVSL